MFLSEADIAYKLKSTKKNISKSEKKEAKKNSFFDTKKILISLMVAFVVIRLYMINSPKNEQHTADTKQNTHIQAEKHSLESNESSIKILQEKKTLASTKQKEYDIVSKKRRLYQLIENQSISINLFGDQPEIASHGTTYVKGMKIGVNGEFVLKDIEIQNKNNKNILSSVMSIDVFDADKNKKIKTFHLKIGKEYTIKYYDGAIELINKKTQKSSGIKLPGEDVGALALFIGSKTKENNQCYFFKLSNGTKVVDCIKDKDIN